MSLNHRMFPPAAIHGMKLAPHFPIEETENQRITTIGISPGVEGSGARLSRFKSCLRHLLYDIGGVP